MNARIRHQDRKLHEQAPAASVARKDGIDTMLARLQRLSPDASTWSPIGTLEHDTELLKRITDSAFNEGEHAG